MAGLTDPPQAFAVVAATRPAHKSLSRWIPFLIHGIGVSRQRQPLELRAEGKNYSPLRQRPD
jgi:hypothetical protein